MLFIGFSTRQDVHLNNLALIPVAFTITVLNDGDQVPLLHEDYAKAQTKPSFPSKPREFQVAPQEGVVAAHGSMKIKVNNPFTRSFIINNWQVRLTDLTGIMKQILTICRSFTPPISRVSVRRLFRSTCGTLIRILSPCQWNSAVKWLRYRSCREKSPLNFASPIFLIRDPLLWRILPIWMAIFISYHNRYRWDGQSSTAFSVVMFIRCFSSSFVSFNFGFFRFRIIRRWFVPFATIRDTSRLIGRRQWKLLLSRRL